MGSQQAKPAPRAARLPVIGIVGGIGAGKSAVAAALAAEGCVVCDSDALAAQAYDDPEVVAALRSWWGDRVFAPPVAHGRARSRHARTVQGNPHRDTPDRARIAKIVFADAAERARLEGLIHPWIAARREALFAAAPAGTRALVIDAPLLLEAGLGAQCDAIIFVDTPLEKRQARVLANRGWDIGEHSRRELVQWPLDRKRANAHHVVRNEGSPDALRAQVRQVLEAVEAAHGGAHR